VGTLFYKIAFFTPGFPPSFFTTSFLLIDQIYVKMPLKKPRHVYIEETITRAISDITVNGLSQHQAAQKYGVPQQTLSARIKGQTALTDQIQPSQYLSKNQEAKLVSWILRQESLGYAPSHSQIRACVQAILQQQGSNPKLGRHWVERLVQRHPELKTKRGRRQEANRFDSFTPKAVNWFFDIREDYSWIKPENTVNVDKGGIIAGFGILIFPFYNYN
jgi:hypothetical protein